MLSNAYPFLPICAFALLWAIGNAITCGEA